MNHLFIRIAQIAILLTASACKQPPDTTPLPNSTADTVKQELKNRSGNGSDSNYGVPTADSVFPDTAATQPVAPTGRPSGAMTPAQEKSGMPLPGQNNDHSAPLATVTTTIRPQ